MELAIRPAVPKYCEPARRLYIQSFPEEERRPWEQIIKTRVEFADARGPYLHLILLEKGLTSIFVGFITIWYFDEFTYIEHFAIMPQHRNKGLGQSLLEDMMENLDKPMVVEVERPGASAFADRRIAFYTRTGFYPLGYDYIQPSYGPGLPEVPMQLMSDDEKIDPARVAEILRTNVYRQ